MRKTLYTFLVSVILSSGNIFGQSDFFELKINRITDPYVQLGNYYYDKAKYDSALITYSIAYILSNGHHPLKISVNSDSQKKLFKSAQASSLDLKIAKVLYYLGEFAQSKNILEKINESNLKDEWVKGIYYYYMGLVYSKLYDYETSLLNYLKSLNIIKDNVKDSLNVIGLITCDIGNVYYNKGNYNEALEYYQISKELLLNNDKISRSKLAIITNNIGSIYFRMGDNKTAIEYYKAAIKMQQHSNVDYSDLSMYYNNIAGIYLMINELDSSEKYYNISLNIREKYMQNLNMLIQSYNQLGQLYYFKKDYFKSLRLFQKAINCNTVDFSDTSAFSLPPQANVIDYRLMCISMYYKAVALYGVYKNGSNKCFEYLDAAYKTFLYLFKYFDYLYVNHANELNYEYFVSFNREVLNAAIDIFYDEKYLSNEEIVSLIQKGKSIYLYQSILETEAKEFAKVPSTLVSLEKKIRVELSQNNFNIQLIQNKSFELENSIKFASLINDRNKLTIKLDSLISIFHELYPDYYNLKYDFSTIPIGMLQEKLVDNEALIEYHFTDSILYIVIITQKTISICDQRSSNIEIEVNDNLRAIKFFNRDKEKIFGEHLYCRLIEPVEEILRIEKINKLIIIPDKILCSFPFETLIISNSDNDYLPNYLIIDYIVSYHFTSSLWYKNFYKTNSKINNSDIIRLFALAPIFNSDKEHIADNMYQHLPNSEKEIDKLEKLFADSNIDVYALYSRNATKQNFLDYAHNYSIIHIASHGFYNLEHPELSGIVFYNETLYPQSDLPDEIETNILYVDETYNLSLSADLVVLSACSTGEGKEVTGEGLLTLYRGLFYSGAKNIIYSLWNINDRQTSDFMITFYTYVLKGNSFSNALRQAKLTLLRNQKTTLPIFWSNFILLGN